MRRPVLRLQSWAWSFACLVRFARWTKKKERLLVVYSLFPRVKWGQQEHDGHYYQSDNFIWGKQKRREPLSCSLLICPHSPVLLSLDWTDWKGNSCREYDAERSSYTHKCLAFLSLPTVLQWLLCLWTKCGSLVCELLAVVTGHVLTKPSCFCP